MGKLFFTLTGSLMFAASAAAAWNTDGQSFPVTEYGDVRQENLCTAGNPGGPSFIVFTKSEDSHANLYLQVIDSEGNALLGDNGKKINTKDGPSYLSAGIGVAATADNKCIIMSGDNRATTEAFQSLPYIYVVDAEGNVVGNPDGEGIASGVENANKYALYSLGGNYYATFDANDPGTYNAFTYVARLDSEGKPIWDAPMKTGGGNAGLVEAADGGFWVLYVNSNKLMAMKYNADGTPALGEQITVHPKVSMWGTIAAYSDGEGGVYLPYEYTDESWNTIKPLAHISSDGTLDAFLLKTLSPIEGMSVFETGLKPLENDKFLLLTSLRKGWEGDYMLYGVIYDKDGKMLTNPEDGKIDATSVGPKINKMMTNKSGQTVVVYEHPESYTETWLNAVALGNDCKKVWDENLLKGEGLSQFSVLEGEGSFVTYFVDAPSDTQKVGVRGIRASLKGGFTVSPYDLDITLKDAGTLKDFIPEDMTGVESMRVAGPINGTDVKVIRSVAKMNVPLEGDKGTVTTFDFKDTRIVSGGDSYYTHYDTDVWDNVDEYTVDDVFPAYIFSGYSVENVMLPESIKAVGDDALYDCAKVSEINLPAGVERIGSNAFAGTAIKSIVIPESVSELGAYCFYSTNLEAFELPDKVTVLPEGMVQATFIRNIDLDGRVTEIGLNAFKDCAYLEEVKGYENVKTIKNYAFYNCIALKSAPVSGILESIGTEAFANCAALGDVIIPASLSYIGQRAFANAVGIKRFTVADGNTAYKSLDGVIYGKDMKNVVVCPSGYNGKVEVPEGVEAIMNNGFEACALLTEVFLPASLKEIGNEAFKFCAGLQSIVCMAVVPPVLGWDEPFGGVDTQNCLLTVPSESVEAYSNAEGWKEFTIKASGVNGVGQDLKGAVYYTSDGVRLGSRPSASGVYIEKRPGMKARKVVIR